MLWSARWICAGCGLMGRCSRTGSHTLPKMSQPGLFDVCVGHACYVVGYCARNAFCLDADLVIWREQFRVIGPCREKGLHDLFGVGVFDF